MSCSIEFVFFFFNFLSTSMVMDLSVASFVFNDSVILAADVLGWYDSLAKYRK